VLFLHPFTTSSFRASAIFVSRLQRFPESRLVAVHLAQVKTSTTLQQPELRVLQAREERL
jgi:hypothetical protein